MTSARPLKTLSNTNSKNPSFFSNSLTPSYMCSWHWILTICLYFLFKFPTFAPLSRFGPFIYSIGIICWELERFQVWTHLATHVHGHTQLWMLTLSSYNYVPFWGGWVGKWGAHCSFINGRPSYRYLSTRIMTTRPNNNYKPPPPIPTQIPCVLAEE
jgi:hypothetical protein